MSEHVKLEASDGHELDAYVAHPEGGPIAGLVVVQELFGVNRHIRSVADGYAKEGFLTVAPALFDRYERVLELGYEVEEWARKPPGDSFARVDQFWFSPVESGAPVLGLTHKLRETPTCRHKRHISKTCRKKSKIATRPD